ncbi:D-glycero-beta-D-manno-heptose 1-phosphate adenylyltransferase [Pedobacter punctiformis]|uniref:D-glycero-beta-D-manno-heptose 1-phosphate adenylyltransferase n=1 Tax=Pedobacter punctiformis TaxID=3004097 RepID=A0ABT4L8Y4_9SPHI|nr:D-glycero-beta-D-manno-heptose 1-phosphate adenylyltransferase [Pedobacter sp. HCMS5-2]MCZ4244316.1 D-glycero-beta-D-manno-heptose 1-phosphate adenylyltransferase [Pedobacter sp. HCMS5-2]
MGRDTAKVLKDKILNPDNLKAKIEDWKNKNQKIVFTNGCFDLLHPGHIAYLNEAASLGDKLIIGLNTDASVKKIKGENRPVNNEYSRAQLLAAMFFIDAIVLFNEDTPLQLIQTIEPDVLVKGGDYKIETIVGAAETLEKGGKVEVLSFLPGYSSTAIIEKIKKEG